VLDDDDVFGDDADEDNFTSYAILICPEKLKAYGNVAACSETYLVKIILASRLQAFCQSSVREP
jgi:hypothetical protein